MPNIVFSNETEAARELREAYQSNDGSRIEQAWAGMQQVIANTVLQKVQSDAATFRQTQDKEIVAQRGYRTLTSREEKWYQKVIGALRSSDPKQAFTQIIGSESEEDLMPETILNDVYKRLQEKHPLLSLLNIQQVPYTTKWIFNNHTAQNAVWGTITAAVEKEITSSFIVRDVHQNKLSCYAVIERGLLDLGPVFLDNYIRTCLYEAMSCGLELGVVSGTGKDQPIGMDRDLGDASYNVGTGWKKKTATVVTSFKPAEYGALLAKLAKDEMGKQRTITRVVLICSPVDYLTRIMPATTVLTTAGTYANNLFPFPTTVVQSRFLAEGEALLGLVEEYTLLAGRSPRNNVIEYDDSVKFLEDQRVFKIVQYGEGRAYDNTSFLLLDISGLNPANLRVEVVENP